MSRLSQMRKYLAEALKEPEENKLYIEDLYLSIAYFEKSEQMAKDAQRSFDQRLIQVSVGFVLAN